MIDRRDFIAMVAASVVIAVRPANAQPAGKVWRIGSILLGDPPKSPEPGPARKAFAEVDAAAKALGMSLLRVQLNTPQDFDSATAAIIRERPDALMLNPNPVNLALRNEIAQFALKQRLPAVAARREEALAGMLIAYGLSLADMLRDTAVYVDKIFKGADPAALPVTQPTKFELVVNARTAKALGLAIPQALLVRADEVLQ